MIQAAADHFFPADLWGFISVECIGVIYLRYVNMQSNGFIELFNYLYLFGTSERLLMRQLLIRNTETVLIHDATRFRRISKNDPEREIHRF